MGHHAQRAEADEYRGRIRWRSFGFLWWSLSFRVRATSDQEETDAFARIACTESGVFVNEIFQVGFQPTGAERLQTPSRTLVRQPR